MNLTGIVDALEDRLVSQPFEGRTPELLATANIEDDDFIARVVAERSKKVSVAVIDASASVEPASSDRDVTTLTVQVLVGAPAVAGQFRTYAALHEWLRALFRADATLGGAVIEAGVVETELVGVYNSPRALLSGAVELRYESD